MNKLILTFAVGSLLLYSCGNSSNEKLNNQTEVAEHNDHHHDDESEAIELNNGEKWQVDANMITHIRNMENDVVSYAKVEQKITNHYLKNYNQTLIYLLQTAL